MRMTLLKTALLGFPPDSSPALLSALGRQDSGFSVAAVCEGDPARLAEAGRLLPEAALYKDEGDFFSKCGRLDAAVIAVPPARRQKTALRALQNRLHAACLTPLCGSTSEFEDLRDEAARAERIVFPLQPWERSAAWLTVDKAISGGLLGELDYAEVQALSDSPAPAGGVTSAYGWFAFSLLLALVRRPPSALAARLSPPPSGGVAGDGAAAVHVHFGGTDGFVRLAAGRHAPLVRLAAHGSKGRLELDGKTLRLDIKDMKPETVELRHGLAGGADRADWLAAELEDLRKEIAGELPRGSGLRNARYCAKLVRNAYYSAAVKSAAVPL